jgi:hypothetical protein
MTRIAATLVLGALTLAGGLGVPATSAAGTVQDDGHVTPKFTTDGGVNGFRTANTIPYWSSSFSFGGKVYPYTMVGTNPATKATTTVPTIIIPLKFTFSPKSNIGGGNFSDVRDPYTVDPATGLTSVQETLNSPIFQNASYPDNVGTTQFGDAIQRATFNQTGSSSYHVLLGQPTVAPEQTIAVPANLADVHSISARIDIGWFSNQIHQLMNKMHIPATTLPIFVTYNTFLYQNNDISNCCVFGYHGALTSARGNGAQQVQTYIYASWVSPGIFSGGTIQDINGLSHEVAEWLNDPFVDNIVPPWSLPSAPQYGCSNVLEAGDPLVGYAYPITVNGFTYHPQVIPILPWFARQSPSQAVAGAYSYPDTNVLTSPATGC